jgi:hypothetical protein
MFDILNGNPRQCALHGGGAPLNGGGAHLHGGGAPLHGGGAPFPQQHLRCRGHRGILHCRLRSRAVVWESIEKDRGGTAGRGTSGDPGTGKRGGRAKYGNP